MTAIPGLNLVRMEVFPVNHQATKQAVEIAPMSISISVGLHFAHVSVSASSVLHLRCLTCAQTVAANSKRLRKVKLASI